VVATGCRAGRRGMGLAHSATDDEGEGRDGKLLGRAPAQPAPTLAGL
jgi:hypothetical protein